MGVPNEWGGTITILRTQEFFPNRCQLDAVDPLRAKIPLSGNKMHLLDIRGQNGALHNFPIKLDVALSLILILTYIPFHSPSTTLNSS